MASLLLRNIAILAYVHHLHAHQATSPPSSIALALETSPQLGCTDDAENAASGTAYPSPLINDMSHPVMME